MLNNFLKWLNSEPPLTVTAKPEKNSPTLTELKNLSTKAEPSTLIELETLSDTVVTNQSYQERTRHELQTLLDNPPPRQVLKLIPQEYPGPLFINKTIILDGQGATLWALQGPVLSIDAPAVTLKNLNIEVTGENLSTAQANCAIYFKRQTTTHFDQVHLHGQVLGLSSEEGEWHYPHSLSLGTLASNTSYQFLLRLLVPTPCTLESEIYGINLIPTQLTAGPHEIILHLDPLRHDTCLHGSLYLNTHQLKRRIHLTAYISSTIMAPTTMTPVVIWSPPQWSNPTATATPSQPLLTSDATVVSTTVTLNDQKEVLTVTAAPAPLTSSVFATALSPTSSLPVSQSTPVESVESNAIDNVFLKMRSSTSPQVPSPTNKSTVITENSEPSEKPPENVFMALLRNKSVT